ncbi:MAG: hypothetical protein PHO66_07660 [Eubacteriales bacterium]|nr:hypothetical protein [Eubacteriales bacterium]
MVFTKLEEEFFYNFSQEERRQMKELLERMSANMQNAEAMQNQQR